MLRFRTILSLMFLPFAFVHLMSQQVSSGYHVFKIYNDSPADSAWSSLSGAARGCWVTPDLDQDGKPELIVTDYSWGGRINLFEATRPDTLELLWNAPFNPTVAETLLTSSGFIISRWSTPRYVQFGDMDRNGKPEIIVSSGNVGHLFYEWDGIPGSHNFGTSPIYVFKEEGTVAWNSEEQFQVADVDGDSIQELIFNKRSGFAGPAVPTAEQGYYVYSFDGQFSTGFVAPRQELFIQRNQLGLGGSPSSFVSADLNGDGTKELVGQAWNALQVFTVKVAGHDQYTLPQKSYTFYPTDGLNDDVSLFGSAVGDIDKDGTDEVFFTAFYHGDVWMLKYNRGDDPLIVDSSHVFKIASGFPSQNCFMSPTVADVDGNGKREIYIGSSYPNQIIQLEFQGGDPRDSLNWRKRVIYTGDGAFYSQYTYRDSVGVRDTLRTGGDGFASKIFAGCDLDGNGKQEIVAPYQSLPDSITYKWMHYDTSSHLWKTDSQRTTPNKDHRWVFRIFESDNVTGIKEKDYVVITPSDYRLDQNYPNPFNPSTKISFYLPVDKVVSLTVYDMLGREVKALLKNEHLQQGAHSVVWDGKNNIGKDAPSGTYVYTLKFGNFQLSKKMTLVR